MLDSCAFSQVLARALPYSGYSESWFK